MRPGTFGWFARHEARLAWRDWLSLMTAGRRRRARTVAVGVHRFRSLRPRSRLTDDWLRHDLRGPADTHVLVAITVVLRLGWSLMLSQAMESVTRAFYARGDLELILTSPAAASRLFAVRIAAMAVTVLAMALVLGAPFIDVLVLLGGARWLGGLCGRRGAGDGRGRGGGRGSPSRCSGRSARGAPAFVAQIVAAVIGAAFAITRSSPRSFCPGRCRMRAFPRSPGCVKAASGTRAFGGRRQSCSAIPLRWPLCSAPASWY